MLLRNAHVCMNSNQTGFYFLTEPLSFEEWVVQGPRGRHIPDDSIFSTYNCMHFLILGGENKVIVKILTTSYFTIVPL